MFLGSTATRTGSKVLSSSVMPRTTAGASGRPSPKSICCVNTRSPDPSFNPQLAFGTPEPNFPFRITLFFRQPHPRGNPTLTQQNRISVGAQAVLRGRNSVMVYPSRPDATALFSPLIRATRERSSRLGSGTSFVSQRWRDLGSCECNLAAEYSR